MEFEKLYTAEDVAEITGLTLRTIRNYIKSGKLTGRRIGVQWRFTAADIQALFDTPAGTPGQAGAEEEERAGVPEDEAAAAAEQSGGSPEGANTETVTASPEEEGNLSDQTGSAAEEAAPSGEGKEEAGVSGSDAAEAMERFLQRKKAPRASACCVVDMPGMTEQEARFLWNRLQTLAAVYEDTPKRLEITFFYDENRDQARFSFSGALDAACAMMNLCDVQ